MQYSWLIPSIFSLQLMLIREATTTMFECGHPLPTLHLLPTPWPPTKLYIPLHPIIFPASLHHHSEILIPRLRRREKRKVRGDNVTFKNSAFGRTSAGEPDPSRIKEVRYARGSGTFPKNMSDYLNVKTWQEISWRPSGIRWWNLRDKKGILHYGGNILCQNDPCPSSSWGLSSGAFYIYAMKVPINSGKPVLVQTTTD